MEFGTISRVNGSDNYHLIEWICVMFSCLCRRSFQSYSWHVLRLRSNLFRSWAQSHIRSICFLNWNRHGNRVSMLRAAVTIIHIEFTLGAFACTALPSSYDYSKHLIRTGRNAMPAVFYKLDLHACIPYILPQLFNYEFAAVYILAYYTRNICLMTIGIRATRCKCISNMINTCGGFEHEWKVPLHTAYILRGIVHLHDPYAKLRVWKNI